MGLGFAKSLEEVDYQDFEEVKKRVLSSPAYQQSQKYLTKQNINISEDELMTLSSVLTGMLTLAWMDRELTNLEVKYILREAKGWCGLDREDRKFLVGLHSHLVHEKPQFEEYIAWHLAWLKRNLNSKDAEKFFEDLVIVSRSDLEIEKREVNLLKKVASFLDIDHNKQDEFIVNAKFIVIQRLEDAAEDDSMEVLERPYAVPKIVLESVD